jgi:hypothetical protein
LAKLATVQNFDNKSVKLLATIRNTAARECFINHCPFVSRDDAKGFFIRCFPTNERPNELLSETPYID